LLKFLSLQDFSFEQALGQALKVVTTPRYDFWFIFHLYLSIHKLLRIISALRPQSLR